MLTKLMKYDLKKMFKLVVRFYLISVVLAWITRIINIWSDVQLFALIGAIFAGCTYSAVASIIINTFIHILMRFVNNFYKDQSYLTHTLPVKKDSLILSKFLSALIVVLTSILVCFLSLFIIFYSPEFMQGLKISLESVVNNFNMSSGLFVFLIILILFLQICSMMAFAFNAIVKAYSYNRNRGIKGFLWFVAYYMICMITTLLLVVLVTAITGDINTLFANTMASSTFLTLIIVCIISYACFAIIFYFNCKKEFNKGVNID